MLSFICKTFLLAEKPTSSLPALLHIHTVHAVLYCSTVQAESVQCGVTSGSLSLPPTLSLHLLESSPSLAINSMFVSMHLLCQTLHVNQLQQQPYNSHYLAKKLIIYCIIIQIEEVINSNEVISPMNTGDMHVIHEYIKRVILCMAYDCCFACTII